MSAGMPFPQALLEGTQPEEIVFRARAEGFFNSEGE